MLKNALTNRQINLLDHGYVRLLDVAGSDREIVQHARTSTGGQDDVRSEAEDKKLLFYLYRNRHTSPFEMGKFWFEVMLPIFSWRQWVRHRTQNMNEISGRYSQLPDKFYIPAEWRRQAATNKQSSIITPGFNPSITVRGDTTEVTFDTTTKALTAHCKMSYQLYEAALAAGVSKEQARFFLPVNIYTKMHVCFDLHNLLHFIRLRDDSHAQGEIQVYGGALGFFAGQYFPWTMEAFRRYPLRVIDTETETITKLSE